ncbi:uncharacterized protein LOC135132867 isoform X4 [Zophobas morio]|uniref:uncharacterized protein LOC135132867 isoform X4 n=1 Tax=Zophobas morio TaxID=2755281 RepID=UPI003083E128
MRQTLGASTTILPRQNPRLRLDQAPLRRRFPHRSPQKQLPQTPHLLPPDAQARRTLLEAPQRIPDPVGLPQKPKRCKSANFNSRYKLRVLAVSSDQGVEERGATVQRRLFRRPKETPPAEEQRGRLEHGRERKGGEDEQRGVKEGAVCFFAGRKEEEGGR